MLTSPFAKLYTAMQTYIAAQVPEITFIDHEFDQLETPERPQVTFPCLLIDFAETQYEDRQLSQMANMQISLLLVFDRWNNTSSITTATRKEQGLQYYEIEQKLHEALQGWNNSGTLNLPFRRVSTSSVKKELQGMRVRRMVYAAQYEDETVGGA